MQEPVQQENKLPRKEMSLADKYRLFLQWYVSPHSDPFNDEEIAKYTKDIKNLEADASPKIKELLISQRASDIETAMKLIPFAPKTERAKYIKDVLQKENGTVVRMWAINKIPETLPSEQVELIDEAIDHLKNRTDFEMVVRLIPDLPEGERRRLIARIRDEFVLAKLNEKEVKELQTIMTELMPKLAA